MIYYNKERSICQFLMKNYLAKATRKQIIDSLYPAMIFIRSSRWTTSKRIKVKIRKSKQHYKACKLK